MRNFKVTLENAATHATMTVTVRAADLLSAGAVAEADYPGWLAVSMQAGR